MAPAASVPCQRDATAMTAFRLPPVEKAHNGDPDKVQDSREFCKPCIHAWKVGQPDQFFYSKTKAYPNKP